MTRLNRKKGAFGTAPPLMGSGPRGWHPEGRSQIYRAIPASAVGAIPALPSSSLASTSGRERTISQETSDGGRLSFSFDRKRFSQGAARPFSPPSPLSTSCCDASGIAPTPRETSHFSRGTFSRTYARSPLLLSPTNARQHFLSTGLCAFFIAWLSCWHPAQVGLLLIGLVLMAGSARDAWTHPR